MQQTICFIDSWTCCGRIKIPYPLEWGAPTFDAGHAFGMMAAVLVSLVEVLRPRAKKWSLIYVDNLSNKSK